MRVIIQRVTGASVAIDGAEYSRIERGMLVLLGIETGDTAEDAVWLVKKITGLRIFDDADGVMNFDLSAVDGEVLVVSQFTLHASTRKGNRPSYIRAAEPAVSEPLYKEFCISLSAATGKPVKTGVFGADMKVSLTNDGPVTIIIDSRLRE